MQEHYRQLTDETDEVAAALSDEERSLIGRYLEQVVVLVESHAEAEMAALRDSDDDSPHEPVELWG